MTVRAGIAVTGTELLSGRVSDRNGPWLAERLGELGIEVADIVTVGDRPEDLEAALRFLADQGADLIVTSGGLGPTADDLTAEVVGRFAGRELVLDEEMEEKIARIVAGFARRMKLRPGRPAGGEPQAGDGSARRGRDRPGRHSAGPRGPGRRWPHGDRSARARRESCRRCGRSRSPRPRHGPSSTAPSRSPRAGCCCSGSPSPRSRSRCARSSAETDLSALEITTCLRRAELEVDLRHRPGAEAAADAVVEGIRRAPRPARVQPRRQHDRRAGRRAARGPPHRPRRVVHGGPARRAADRAPRRLRLRRRRRRRLLERGEGRAARRRPRADRGSRSGLARGRRAPWPTARSSDSAPTWHAR